MKLLKKIVWFLNRLSVMNRQELVYRFIAVFIIIRAQLPFRTHAKNNYNSKVNFLNEELLRKYLSFVKNCQWVGLEENKESLLSNRYQTLSFTWEFESDESWFTCPATGFVWPKGFFTDINYRAGGDNGDIRVVWESSRLQQLVALAYIANNDKINARNATTIYLSQFNSWYQQNPPYKGPHYISVMECALRIIALSFSSSLMKEHISDKDYWLKQSNLITSHAEIIFERLSLHSSSGNHTITEAVGLIFAGKLYSNHPRACKWSEVGSKLFIKEFLRQTNSDGSGIEQASWYLKFIFELALISVPLLDLNSVKSIKERLDAVESFLAELTVNKQLFSYGDSDSGYAVSRYIDFAIMNKREATDNSHFKDAGLIKISHANSVVFFDYGNLGMAPGFGHGHADCLTIVWYFDGRCILNDRGTYTYNGSEKLRHYFRSTSAHNTVVINQQDQSIQSSRFMWKNDVESQLVTFEKLQEGTYVLAKHFGYSSRFDCIHWRGVFVSSNGDLFVWDYIEGQPETIEVYWHFDSNVELDGNSIVNSKTPINILGLGDVQEQYNNQLDIPIGISSSEYGMLLPSFSIKDEISPRESQLVTFNVKNANKKLADRVSCYFQEQIQKNGTN